MRETRVSAGTIEGLECALTCLVIREMSKPWCLATP